MKSKVFVPKANAEIRKLKKHISLKKVYNNVNFSDILMEFMLFQKIFQQTRTKNGIISNKKYLQHYLVLNRANLRTVHALPIL